MSNVSHGLSRTKLYKTWDSMIARCQNPNNAKYISYGALGVTVCEAWKDPRKFMAWALLNGFCENLTIERINPYGNYEPSNCIWIPARDQAANKRKSSKNTSGYSGVSLRKDGKWQARVTVNGERKTIGSYGTALEAHKARGQYFIDNELQEHLKLYELQHSNN